MIISKINFDDTIRYSSGRTRSYEYLLRMHHYEFTRIIILNVPIKNIGQMKNRFMFKSLKSRISSYISENR